MKKYKSLLIYALFIVGIFSCFTSNATNKTWIGTTSTAWATGSNWSGGSAPSTSDTVTIDSISNNVINNPVLSANDTIKRLIMISGSLNLGSYTLTVNASGDYSGGIINSGLLIFKGSTHTFSGTTFGASISSKCVRNELNGGMFNAVVVFEDTTNTSTTSNGGCTFNAAVTLIKGGTGGGSKIHANSAANIFNSTLTITNAGTAQIQMSTSGTNYYKGNITVTCTGSGGIYFGTSGGGISVLDSTNKISVGSGGFTAGTLLLRDFWQTGNASQFIRLTSSAVLNCINAYFNAPTVLNAPALALKTSTFYDSITCVHTGATRTNSEGGNIFLGTTLLIDSGAGYFRLGVSEEDIFYGNTTFKGIGGRIQIGYGSQVLFAKNISQTGDVSFANGFGMTVLHNYWSQTITSTDSLIRFKYLYIDKSSDSSGDSLITLNHDVRVDSLLEFVKGKIISSSGATLIIDTGCVVIGASDSAFVSGPVKKKGKNAFVFPIGKDAVYRALEMSAPASATDAFTAEYFNTEQTLGDSLDTTFHYLSQCDYWNFERNGGSSNVTVSLHFKSPTCGILDSANLRIAKWNSTVWNNKGTGTFTGNQTNGKLATPSALTSYGYLCLLYRLPPITFITTVTPLVFSMSRDMQPDFNGYNGTNTITVGQTWDDLSANLPNVRSLYPHNLRYPGGTVANYWNWGEGNFLEEYQFTSGIAGLKLTDRFKTLNSDLDAKQNILSNFKKSVDVTGSAPIFNLNIFSSDYPYQKAMLFHAKELSLPVRYIELGNEFYNDFEEHRLVFPSVKDYATKAADWARELKLATWNANSSIQPEIAVVGSWQSPQSDSRQRVWLDNLLPEIDGNTDIDAVTIHQYLGAGFADNSLNSIPRGSCLTDVFGGVDGDPDNAFIPFRSAFNNIDWLKLNDFKKIGDAGKKIWITEFNMGDHTFTTYGSWTQALMVSAMLLGYLEDENVTKVCPHELVGTGIFGAMFNGNTNNLDYADNDGVEYDPVNGASSCDGQNGNTYETQEWGKSASGAAVALISHAIEESTYAEQIDFTTGITSLPMIGSDVDRPVLYGWKFIKPYSIEYIIINMGGDNYAIDPQHIIAAGSGNGYWEYLRAANTDYITGDPGSGGKMHPPSYVGRIAFNPATTFPVTGYSITRVVVPNATACTMMLVATEDHICEGSTTTISLKGIFPNQGSLIAWSSPPELNRVFWQGSALVSPGTGSAGTYTVSVTDGVCTASVTITVDEPPALTAALTGGSSSICPPSETAILTATCATCTDLIWTPSYGLTSTCTSPTNPAPFCDVVTVSPEQTTEYIVYGTDGVCWTSASALPITSQKPEITAITPSILRCYSSTNNNVDLSVTSPGAVDYTWSPSGLTTSTITVSIPTTDVYTVTVTTTGTTCSSSASVNVKVNQNCCLNNNGGVDAVIYETTSPFVASVETLKVQVNASTAYSCTSSGGDYDVTKLSAGTIYINGYLKINQDLTFTGCTIKFGEQAEVHVDKGKILRFTGCTISACSAWTWRSIYAGDGATVIVEDNGGTATVIADADTALNLRDDAKYNVIKSTFTNNYVGMYLYSYKRPVVSGSMGNIYGNTFSASSLKTSPVGSFAYGLSGISLNHNQSIQIGETGTSIANTFHDLYLGIRSSNSSMNVINNYFADIHSLWGTTSGHAIHATSDFDFCDRLLKIGNGFTSGLNEFKSSENGIYALGEQNIIIDKNKFGDANQPTYQLTQKCINITTNNKNINVLSNKFYDFNIGTYFYDIKKSDSTINIHDNEFINADLGLGGSYYGTAITVQNPTQTENNLNIYDNIIENPRIGIHLKNVINGKIYKDVAANGNDISYDIAAATTLTDDYSGILLEDCDNTYVTENRIDNTEVLTSTPEYLQGVNVVASENGNICSNTIDKMGYGFYINGSCTDTKLKLNLITGYERAIYFNNAYFSTQGTTTETWENTFDNSTNWLSVKRLDGSILNLNTIDWHYNSANSNMDVSNNTYNYNGIPSKITPVVGTNGTTDCDALPLRVSHETITENSLQEFKVFPNPVIGDYIYIQNKLSDFVVTYFIYDCTGREVKVVTSDNHVLSILISNLKPGLYNLVCCANNERHNTRFIIQR